MAELKFRKRIQNRENPTQRTVAVNSAWTGHGLHAPNEWHRKSKVEVWVVYSATSEAARHWHRNRYHFQTLHRMKHPVPSASVVQLKSLTWSWTCDQASRIFTSQIMKILTVVSQLTMDSAHRLPDICVNSGFKLMVDILSSPIQIVVKISYFFGVNMNISTLIIIFSTH